MNSLTERMASEAGLKYSPEQAEAVERLVKIAARRKIDLMTTAKDFLRIPENFKNTFANASS